MALWSRSERTPVATVEVAFFEDRRVRVQVWADGDTRQESGYHAILHFMMYYARLLFFLSFRDDADRLVGLMDDAVRRLADAPADEPVTVTEARETAGPDEQPRAVWSSVLSMLKPGEYRCADTRPKDPEDSDAVDAALLHLQALVDMLPTLERAYLALGISGMHEYYRDIQHWNNSKSLHPAPAYGMQKAMRVLTGHDR